MSAGIISETILCERRGFSAKLLCKWGSRLKGSLSHEDTRESVKEGEDEGTWWNLHFEGDDHKIMAAVDHVKAKESLSSI